MIENFFSCIVRYNLALPSYQSLCHLPAGDRENMQIIVTALDTFLDDDGIVYSAVTAHSRTAPVSEG